MPRGKRVSGTASYRTKKRAMRSRRLRRDFWYWLVAAAVGVVALWGVVAVGSMAWRSVSGWWRAREEASARRALGPVSLALVGVDAAKSSKVAIGLGVVQVVPVEGRLRGIVFPGDTFVEVPGQGFEKAQEALRSGPLAAMATVQNLLGVPLDQYVVLDLPEYKALTEKGDAAALFGRVVKTNLTAAQVAKLSSITSKIKKGEPLIVPLPVRTISIGDDIYYEAQKEQVADVLKSWWGVIETPEKRPLRIKILNGVGTPGIAGEAAKPLIRAGFRVVDTTNASDFGVGHTRIVVYHAESGQPQEIQRLLGVGRIVVSNVSQDVVDVVVIIGRDYKPK